MTDIKASFENKMLPNGWILLKFNEVVSKLSFNDKKVKQKDYLKNGSIPVIDQGQAFIGGFTDDRSKVIDCELPVVVFGDHTRIVKLVNFKFAPGADGVKLIKPFQNILPKLFTYFTRVLITKIPDNGYARHFQHLEKIFIPIPPLAEQHRIVEKIEELFSDLDKGIESLKTTQQQLKIYRQAVLKWAFEGRLTAKWREEKKQQGELKSAEELLDQIKAEREKRDRTQLQEWHEAVKTWEANGKQGKKPGKPRTLKELPSLTENEIVELPKLPDKWRWERLGNLADIIGGVTKGRKLEGKETINLPYLRVANVQDGYLDLNEIKYIDVLPSDLEKYCLLYGDILYTEGGDRDKLGRGTLWKSEIENCIHQNHIFRARLLNNYLLSLFVAYFSSTRTAKDYFYRRAKQTVNLASINMTILSNFPIPVLSELEQIEVIQEIEFRLSICDRLEATITENLTRAEALRQSILKQAFEGKLVPQDPNDEPAEKLIERIRQEKQQQINGKQLELEVFVDREKIS